MSQQQRIKKDLDSHIYYTANLYNPATATIALNGNYVDNRSDIILNNPADYHCNVVRASIPASDIPIFHFLDNAYALYMVYRGSTYTATVTFTQGDFSSANPNNTFRNVYNYQAYCDMINNAFTNVYNQVNTAWSGAQPPQSAPIMTYTPSTELFSIVLDDKYSPSIATATTGTVQIYFNCPLGQQFETFDFNFYGYNSPTCFGLVVDNLNNGLNGTGTITLVQEGSTIAVLQDIQGIAVVSNSIPVVAEQLPLGNSTGSAPTLSVLLDLETNVNNPVTSAGYYQYAPQIWRPIDMKNGSPLSRIDLSIYYYDRQGTLFPLVLSPGRNFNIKLLFEKKENLLT